MARLKDTRRAALAKIMESGPISAAHGVVRRRLIDLCQWIFDPRRSQADHDPHVFGGEKPRHFSAFGGV